MIEKERKKLLEIKSENQNWIKIFAATNYFLLSL